MSRWAEYQTEAKRFFTQIGFTATENAEVSGSRGKHLIDVLVTFSRFGISHTWIVECKHWKTRIPKEKVLALQAIAQDLGADKAFLLSESGFQAGAISCTRHSNIVLSSLDTLKGDANDELVAFMIDSKLAEHEEIMDGLRDMTCLQEYRKGDRSGSFSVITPAGHCELIGRLAIIEHSLREAKKGKFPVAHDFGPGDTYLVTSDVPTLLASVDYHLGIARRYLEQHKDFKP